MARKTLAAATLGQLLAFLIAVTAVSSAALARQGLSAPTLQSSLNYLLLVAVYGIVHVRAVGWRLKARWWAYALLALLDVEGNFCLVLAYKYTSLTSVTLLDSFTIPMVVVLSAGLLGAAYRRGHYIGAATCIAGLALLVITDHGVHGADAGTNPLLGDGLVLLGATLYALCNCLQEWLLGDVPIHELLCMLGLFGSMYSAAQGLPWELPTLLSAAWSPAALLPFLGFGAAMFAFYSLVPHELRWGGAALLNISLLASDLWTAAARALFFGGFAGYSLACFLASLLVTAAGILLFTYSGDVETRLGAGAAAVGGTALPAYQPVPHAERQSLPSISSKDAQQALEQVRKQRPDQRSWQQAQQQQQQQGEPQRELANPFDIASSPLGSSQLRGGFLPLPMAEASWQHGTEGNTPSSPAATLSISVDRAPAADPGPELQAACNSLHLAGT